MHLSHIRTQLINNGLVKPLSKEENNRRSMSAAIESRRRECSPVPVTVKKK
jgi:hypothetical protein